MRSLICPKYKELKHYEPFYMKWICNGCWTENHSKAVILQLKPFRFTQE